MMANTDNTLYKIKHLIISWHQSQSYHIENWLTVCMKLEDRENKVSQDFEEQQEWELFINAKEFELKYIHWLSDS